MKLSSRQGRDRLSCKHVLICAALVGATLLASGLVQLWFTYQQTSASQCRIEREQAATAAATIIQFFTPIEPQIQLVNQSLQAGGSVSDEQRRAQYEILVNQVLPITALRYLDADGRERIFVSRLARTLVGSGADYSRDPTVAESKRTGKTAYSVGSTERAATLGDRRWHELKAQHHTLVRRELARHGGQEVDTAGDSFFATFDVPDHAVRCACAIRDAVRGLGLEIRAGLHTGEVERQGAGLSGIAVHIGRRVEEQAGPGEILVSSTVKDLVAGARIPFVDRGPHHLRGVPDEWRLFAVAAG